MDGLIITHSMLGGALIGISAVMMLWLFGRIAGISGFIHDLIPPKRHEVAWRLYFLFGMFVGGLSYYFLPHVYFSFREHYPWALTLLGGMLVGFGTRMGSGCTSGHGVCGVSRFSARSIVATAIFIFTGVITVALLKHLLMVV